MNQVDHKKFNQGSKELGFYKFFYQLFLHSFGRKYCEKGQERIIILLDERQSKYPLSDLRDILNRGIAKRYGINHHPFVAIEPRDSKSSELIQTVDLLLGAIGYQKNGCNLLAGASIPKTELANYICKKAGLQNLQDSTKFNKRRFTIWNFKLQK